MNRVCLIVPHHISFQPRALREADSLHEAGYDVRVVCRQADQDRSSHDVILKQTRSWSFEAIDICPEGSDRRRWFVESVQWKLYRRLFQLGVRTDRVAIGGYVKGWRRLRDLATRERADWFIAHTQAALPLAVEAARLYGARVGFDCEDLLAENGTDPSDIVRWIERKYLDRCDYVSTASQCMADRLRQRYKSPVPMVLYNVFPLRLADRVPPPKNRPVRPVMRLHWFGQTIGPGRGLEDAVEAMRFIGGGVELHLRGVIGDGYSRALEMLAAKHGVAGRIVYHPWVRHDDLIHTLSEFDVGLALERPEHGNYSRTVTNKVFSYLLAGLAVAATDTPGQREVLGDMTSAAFLYRAGNPRELAEGLRPWLEDRRALRKAQQAAWDAARKRFCWDQEKNKLLDALEGRSTTGGRRPETDNPSAASQRALGASV